MGNIRITMVIAALVAMSSAAWAGTTYYVAPDGNDLNAGTSWATAFATIQKGITSANDGTSGSYAVVNVNTGTYITGPIHINNDNLKISFEEGVTVKARSIFDSDNPNLFDSEDDCLFAAFSKNNIILDGNDTTFRMQKDEYTTGSHRQVINLKSCSNVNISGFTLRDSGGDGVYIGTDRDNANQKYCESILIKNVNCDNNLISAIGVISVDGLTVENCTLQNTRGGSSANPLAGIHFEPNHDYEKLKNIVVRNCEIKNNEKAGISMTLHNLDNGSDDVSILIEDCNVASSFAGIKLFYAYDDGVKGLIEFKNITVENINCGAYLFDKSSESVSVSFINCIWKDLIEDSQKKPIYIVNNNLLGTVDKPGGLKFLNCYVSDYQDDPAIFFTGTDTSDLYEIHGDLHVQNPNSSRGPYYWGNGTTLHHVDIKIHEGLATADINDADPN